MKSIKQAYFDKRQIYSYSILYNDIMEEIEPNKDGEKVKFTKTKSQGFFKVNLLNEHKQHITQDHIAQHQNCNIITDNTVSQVIAIIIRRVEKYMQISQNSKIHSIRQTLDIIVNRQNFYQELQRQVSLKKPQLKADFQPRPLLHFGQPKLKKAVCNIDEMNVTYSTKKTKKNINDEKRIIRKMAQKKQVKIQINKRQLPSISNAKGKRKQSIKESQLIKNHSEGKKYQNSKSILSLSTKRLINRELIGLNQIVKQQREDNTIEALRNFKLIQTKTGLQQSQLTKAIMKQAQINSRKSNETSESQIKKGFLNEFTFSLKKYQLIENCVEINSEQDRVGRNFYSFEETQNNRQRISKNDCKIKKIKNRNTLNNEQQGKDKFQLPLIQLSSNQQRSSGKMINSISEWSQRRHGLKQHKFRLEQFIKSNSTYNSIKLKKVVEANNQHLYDTIQQQAKNMHGQDTPIQCDAYF